jgi:hypothetical protein
VTDTDSQGFVVIDGSNIATQGRSTPSLAQLDEAVRQFQDHFPDVQVIVVVDATFGHRIDASERAAFDEAADHAEIVSPPAGALGRGDAFLLRVAERVGAQVLSNDSFQEFHGEHPWLFREGRLIGGTPVPGVGWIFTPRSPVRGARSREATTASKTQSAIKSETVGDTKAKATVKASSKAAPASKALVKKTTKPLPAKTAAVKGVKAGKAQEPAKKAAQKAGKASGAAAGEKTVKSQRRVKQAAKPEKAARAPKALKAEKPAKVARTKKAETTPVREPEKAQKAAKARGRRGGRGRRATGTQVEAAIEVATEEVLVPGDPAVSQRPSSGGRGKRGGPPAALNDPLTFLTFVSDHPIGARVEGTVSSFTSHGAMVEVGDMHCYAPVAGLGDPAPRRAREVLQRGERHVFVLVALDPPRRGAELALPEVAAVGDVPGR